MGLAHLVLGDIDTAITWSLKASQVNPNNPGVWVRLAVAYAMKGESEKAAAAVAEVLKLNPKFKLSDFGSFKPMSASPPAYKEWYEKKFLPACRKAGLPE
jgi:tetratricopeptide (TPR) repeat protein